MGVTRIAGREFIGNLDQAVTSTALTILAQSVQVNTAGFSARLASIATNFAEWRVAKCEVRQMSSQSQVIHGGFAGLCFVADADADAPTTLDQIVSADGDLGGSQDHLTCLIMPTQWLKTTVGTVNTDVRFYTAGVIYSAVQSDGTNFFNTTTFMDYVVEFRNPV